MGKKLRTRKSKSYRKKNKINKTKRINKYKKYYNMKGCNSFGCDCNKCRIKRRINTIKKRGGSNPIGAYPIKGGSCFKPLIGEPYNIYNNTTGNYYNLPSSDAYSVDRNIILRGGSGLSSFIPDNLLNVGRIAEYEGQSIYNGLAGFKPPTNPLPYKDQGVNFR